MARGCSRDDVAWARCGLARTLRELILSGLLGPAMDLYTRRRIAGREWLEGVDAPVVFVANHSSHMDTPTILRALPRKWRQRTAVGAATDYFYRKRMVAHAVSLAFNTVPVERNGGGLDPDSTAPLDRLLDQRWNLLLFAEGTRTRDGRVGRLRSGAAVLAREHGLAIVPVYVSGTRAAMPRGQSWMRRKPGSPVSSRHAIEIRFGAPIWPGDEGRAEVMERVRLFFAASGAETTPDERLLEGVESDGAAPAVERTASPVKAAG